MGEKTALKMRTSNFLHKLNRSVSGLLLVSAYFSGVYGDSSGKADIVGMGFADLMNVEVTVASRKEQKISQTAAAVYVLTGEGIRRSGATNIPEALRLVPGLEVAQIGSSDWAIAARGFNGTVSNKLLVLIDGRSVYTPLYSGVFWDVQDVQLESIDRIEVIRGPGAAVWGADAVSGVINIIRKHSDETQGTLVSGGVGTEQRAFGGASYGGSFGEGKTYRVYGKYFKKDEVKLLGNGGADDAWSFGEGGFRADWDEKAGDAVVLQGDAYTGDKRKIRNVYSLTPPESVAIHDETSLSGANLQSRWNHTISNTSNLQAQFYYDMTYRDIPQSFTEERHTVDLDFQHQFALSRKQDFIWGAAFRVTTSQVNDTFGISWDPNNVTNEIYSAFFQDEIHVRHNLSLILGAKFEDDIYTDLEAQPTGRILWTVNEKNTLWGAVSRAIRTPTQLDTGIRLVSRVTPGTPPQANVYYGNPDYDTEKLIAYELGYRTAPIRQFSIDLASFFNEFDDLRSLEPGTPFTETNPTPHTVNPTYFENKVYGESYGFEIVPEWQVLDWWRLKGQLSYLHLRLHLKEGSLDAISTAAERADPKYQYSIRSSMNLPYAFELDGTVRHVDQLTRYNIPEYTALDARLGWKGIRNVEIDLIGQNLLTARHQEFSGGGEIERGYYGRVTCHF